MPLFNSALFDQRYGPDVRRINTASMFCLNVYEFHKSAECYQLNGIDFKM